MALVVDASVALKWVLQEPDSHFAQALAETDAVGGADGHGTLQDGGRDSLADAAKKAPSKLPNVASLMREISGEVAPNTPTEPALLAPCTRISIPTDQFPVTQPWTRCVSINSLSVEICPR